MADDKFYLVGEVAETAMCVCNAPASEHDRYRPEGGSMFEVYIMFARHPRNSCRRFRLKPRAIIAEPRWSPYA